MFENFKNHKNNVLSKRLIKKRNSTVRKYFRRYKELFSSGNERFLIDTMRELSTTPPPKHARDFELFLPQDIKEQVVLTTMQFILRRVNMLKLNESILLGSMETEHIPVSIALPSHYCKTLISRGVKVNVLVSILKWHLMCFTFWGYGLYKTFKTVFRQRSPYDFAPQKNNAEGFDYFSGLKEENLPSKTSTRLRTLVDWHIERNPDLTTIVVQSDQYYQREVNGVKVFASPHKFLPLDGFVRKTNFAISSFCVAISAFMGLLVGRWSMALLYYEYVDFLHFKLLEPEHKPKKAFFDNSGWFSRPLWTHLLSSEGGQVTCYFYSTNNFQFKTFDKGRAISLGWELMNWPHYYVWNNLQKDMIANLAQKKAKFEVVGSIWFEDKDCNVVDEELDVIIFDVVPFRPSFYRKLGAPVEFYTQDKMVQFVESICSVCKELDIVPSIKPKRNLKGKHYSKGYARKIKDLSTEGLLNFVDAQISAVRIIEKSTIVIVTPFASPANIAKDMGKHVVYYDPTATILKNDEARFDVPIISSPKELKSIITEYKKRIV